MIIQKRILIAGIILLVGFSFLNLTSAQSFGKSFSGSSGSYSSTYYGSSADFNRYYSSAQLKNYWPQLNDLTNEDSCKERQDLLIQVSPAGCQPTVVRSDLLEEQNVAVFCQLDALQFNPLVDIKQIRNIQFNKDYPEEVLDIAFHPAKAALRTGKTLLGSPLINNIGYVVVVLKKQENEKLMPDFVNFTLSANIEYYSENAIGTGKGEFLLEEVSDKDWEIEKIKNSFFNGKYSLRLLDADSEFADVSIYHQDRKLTSSKLKKGKESRKIYIPGTNCQTSLNLKYEGLEESPDKRVRLQIGEDILELWEGSKFFNKQCVIKDIVGNFENLKVKIKCRKETFILELENKILINENEPIEVVKLDNGKLPEKSENEWRNVFTLSRNENGTLILVGPTGDSENIGDLSNIVPINVENLENTVYSNENYFDKAIGTYQNVAINHPLDRAIGDDSSDYYGELALENAIKLARDYHKNQIAAELIIKFFEIYPNSDKLETLTREYSNLFTRDTSKASKVIEINNEYEHIRLIEVIEPKTKSSAEISWGRVSQLIEKDSNFIFGTDKNITLTRVYNSEKVKVTTYCMVRSKDGEIEHKKKSYTLKIDDEDRVIACDEFLILRHVDIEELAKVRVNTNIKTSGKTNFSIHIGIEKREFELNPNKSRKKIEELNKTIQKWESVSENLGKVVKGLKGACFATAGILTVKNFFMGLDGTALARQQVMQGDNGWNRKCQDMVNDGTYVTLGQCLDKESPNYEKDIEAIAKSNEHTNKIMRDIESKYSEKQDGLSGMLEGNVVDRDKSADEFIAKLREDYGEEFVNIDGKNISVTELVSENSYGEREISYTQSRDLYKYLNLRESGGLINSEIVNDGMEIIGRNIESNKEINQKIGGLVVGDVYVVKTEEHIQGEWHGRNYEYYKLQGYSSSINMDANQPSQLIKIENQIYLATLNELDNENYEVDEIYSVSDNKSLILSSPNISSEVSRQFSSFIKIDASEYQNEFLPGEAKIRFFETEPYKGMPSIVPFDKNGGWYAAARQTLPFGGNTKAYESSGRPSSFWVCNIMNDKRIGFFSSDFGDDQCVQFNIYTGQQMSNFPHLSESETKRLVTRAVRALNEASRHSDKKIGDRINVLGETFEVGTGSASMSAVDCRSYMSNDDCKLIFNLCDPVICPTSRCNLGGKYYVSDVIQSGIIGSALLCLPNIDEGIMMPVCLTGIQAGIDGYLSILKQHQSCLQENIDSGKTVGICDAITSVYTCEFFWRQAAPLTKLLLPKLVESVYYGGNSPGKGGGEYMNVKSAWDNTEGSINYFTESYAVNSLEAFNIRSVEEAGSEVCRAWISMKGPKSFETLIEPDSPPQFHAWFSSIPFTDASLPATAQYKVFYHIFAGKDSGVSYSVYLKDPSEGNYHSPEFVSVVTDFVSKGEAITQTKDFTAPKGYKQLCVRINDKEECGFKQVSTSFALNYVRDEFVGEEMLRNDIKSETECISGSLNAAALLNPNIQEAAQEAIDPAIYNRGVVRICATDNPGTGTDPTRFTEVGYCDNERIKCWLDGQSIDNALTNANTGIRANYSDTLEGIQSAQDIFFEDANLIGNVPINQKKLELNNRVNEVLRNLPNVGAIESLAKEFDETISLTSLNSFKAMFLLLKGEFYEQVFRKLEEPKNEEPSDIDELIEEDEEYEETAEETEEEIEEETEEENGESESPSPGQEEESYYQFGDESSQLVISNFSYNLINCGESSLSIYFADSGPKLIYVDIEYDEVLNNPEQIGDFTSNDIISIDFQKFEDVSGDSFFRTHLEKLNGQNYQDISNGAKLFCDE